MLVFDAAAARKYSYMVRNVTWIRPWPTCTCGQEVTWSGRLVEVAFWEMNLICWSHGDEMLILLIPTSRFSCCKRWEMSEASGFLTLQVGFRLKPRATFHRKCCDVIMTSSFPGTWEKTRETLWSQSDLKQEKLIKLISSTLKFIPSSVSVSGCFLSCLFTVSTCDWSLFFTVLNKAKAKAKAVT